MAGTKVAVAPTPQIPAVAVVVLGVAVVQQANRGDKEAQEVLRQEDEMRAEQGLPPIIEELKAVSEEAELRKRIEEIKVMEVKPIPWEELGIEI